MAAAELSATAGSLEARQAALEARLARLAALHANMVERAGGCRAADAASGGWWAAHVGCLGHACTCTLLCTANWVRLAC